MRLIFSILLGFLSGFLIYFLFAMTFFTPSADTPPAITAVLLIAFFGGWFLSTFLMYRESKTISKVLKRGFLIGAAEWLLMIPAGVIMGGKQVSDMNLHDSASQAGAAIGGGIFAILTGGVSVFMAILCIIGFVVCHLLGREMKAETSDDSNQKCPQCAEMIKKEALVCRYCGYKFNSNQGTVTV